MSRHQQQKRETRTVDYWGGRPYKRNSSDLFLDRPGPSNSVFSGKTIDLFIRQIYQLKGPNALWFQRYPSREHIGDIGEGQASILRSLDAGYLTR